MIEITFREAFRGSLSHAQSYGEGEYPGGYSFITYYNEDGSIMTSSEAKAAEEKAEAMEKARWAAATPLGGIPDDVFNFDMELNVGDISELNCLDKRIESIAGYPVDHPDFDLGEFQRGVQERILLQLESVIKRIKTGESARIWYGNIANERCGIMWLLWSLKKAETPLGRITMVNLTDNLEMKPGDWHKYVKLQQPISKKDVEAAADGWESLMKENSSLRAVVGGKVTSVKDDFFDELIVEEAKKYTKTFQESWLVGDIRDKKPEIPEYWLLSRIDELIEGGVLAVTEEAGSWPRSFRKLTVI